MTSQAEISRLWSYSLAAALAVTLVRIAVLAFSPLQLYPDEAQYWWWAQSLSFGYVSKPPLIAVIVWFTTTIFGNAEWAIRLGSPLLHGATSLILFGIARRAFPGQPRTALWSSLAYLTLPGISYSSGLISTDVPLLFFWAVALYAFLRALDDWDWRWPILCGVAVGLGLLAKYAMVYFAIGAIAAALVAPSARRLAFGLHGLTILAIAAALLSPNMVWNAAHGFPTVAHTAANADWNRARFAVSGLILFVGGQFLVFGPLMMAGLLGAFWRVTRERVRTERELILVAFCLPPLTLMLGQAFISEANANWAAAAYVAGTPLAVHELRRWGARWPLRSSAAINGFVMVVLWICLAGAAICGNDRRRKYVQAPGRLEGIRLHRDRRSGAHALRFVVSREPQLGRGAFVLCRTAAAADPHLGPQLERGQSLRHDHAADPARGACAAAGDARRRARCLRTFDSTTLEQTISLPVGGHGKRIILLYDARDYRGPQNPA